MMTSSMTSLMTSSINDVTAKDLRNYVFIKLQRSKLVEVRCRLQLSNSSYTRNSVNVSNLFVFLSDLYTEGSIVASAANVTGCG